MPAGRELFARYLHLSEPGAARALALQADPSLRSELESLRTTWSRLIRVAEATADDVRSALGEPDPLPLLLPEGTESLAYVLPGNERHAYAFHFAREQGFLVEHGFQRPGPRVALPSPPAAPAEWPAYLRTLAELGATRQEVLVSLGRPKASYGWWPVEDYEYESGLVIELCHGRCGSDFPATLGRRIEGDEKER